MGNRVYKVTWSFGPGQSVSKEFPAPERLPEAGDVYKWVRPGHTLGGAYSSGDTMTVIRRTLETPHDRASSLGNLRIKCKHGVSVWSEFDAAVAEGRLVLV